MKEYLGVINEPQIRYQPCEILKKDDVHCSMFIELSMSSFISQFVDSIPKSAAGKILKKELREDFQKSQVRAQAIV